MLYTYMDEKDILESDVRVTLLGDKGKYSFDWINKEERKVKFIPKDSDFESYSTEAKKLLNKKGIFIKNSELEEGSNNSKSKSDNINETMESTEDTNFEPVSNSNENIENKKDSGSWDDSEHKNNSDQIRDKSEEHSFIVRMSDTKNRREVIDKVRDKYPDASDKLELSGPYRVTYRFEKDNIELVSVDDIGMDKSTDD